MFRNPAQEFVYVRTYSRWLEEQSKRENWPDTVKRYIDFIKKHLGDKIPAKVLRKIEENVLSFNVMPSMRFLWAAGAPAEQDNVTIYNCSFASIDNQDAFAEALYILMCGCGYGFSVENKYVSQLPVIPIEIVPSDVTYRVVDSKAGWADSVKELVNSLYGGMDITMDYNGVRPAGARLKTMGGRASGPGPLAQLHSFIREVFYGARGRHLTSIEAHDILNEIAQIVVVGGVRRSSEISLSDLNDSLMRDAKSGNFPVRRYMANNSAVYNTKPDIVTFMKEWAALIASGSGERGIFNLEAAKTLAPKRRNGELIQGTNPCKPLNSLILTDKGFVTFGQAINSKNAHFTVLDENKELLMAKIPFLTKKDAVVSRVLLSDGTYLYGTPEHRHVDAEGNWVSIKDMEIGTRLKRPLFDIHGECDRDNTNYKNGVLAGWIWGDGWLFPRKDSKGWNFGLCFGVHELDVAKKFEELFNINTVPHPQRPDTCLIYRSHSIYYPNLLLEEGFNIDKSDLTWLYGKDKNFKLGFIEAAFTADGSVRKKNNVELYSIHRNALEVLCNILREYGIASTVNIHNYARVYTAKDGKTRNNKNSYKLNVYSGQFKKFSFLSQRKSELLEKQVTNLLYRYSDYATVMDIELEHSIEDVYDITVDSNAHTFLDGGILTHNCGEIQLRSEEFCNLSEVVVRAEDDIDTMLEKVETATWMGVIQACFVHFPYLNKKWAENCEEERLLGVSMTGQMDAPHLLTEEAIKAYKSKAIKVAKKAANIMGIPVPAAITCVKPSGTVSQLVDSSSGLHPRFSKYYIRRYRISASDPLFKMVRDQGLPISPENGQRESDHQKAEELLRKAANKSEGLRLAKSTCPIFDESGWSADRVNTWVVSFPVAAPKGATTVDDVNAIQQLEWYKKIQKNWCEHNASITVYVRPDEWLSVGDWVYKNWEIVNGISFLPVSDHVYQQAPYEKLTKEEYEKLAKIFPKIDYSQLSRYEQEDNTEGAKSLACASGVCEI